ncbi:hypothetical protein D3C87_1733020 [compost metagenome]
MADTDLVDKVNESFVGAGFEVPAECSFGHAGEGGDVAEADFLEKMLEHVVVHFLHPLSFRNFEIIDIAVT